MHLIDYVTKMTNKIVDVTKLNQMYLN